MLDQSPREGPVLMFIKKSTSEKIQIEWHTYV